jgi:two-component system phosphate regulon response regulator PhoB
MGVNRNPQSTRVLVVEDEPDIRLALRVTLEKKGYLVTEAGNGRSAVDTLEEDRPDLLLLDLMLPDFDGFEILKTIQRSPRLRGIPTIILSARTDETDRILGFELGADDYVTKPFSPRELVLRVQAVLNRVGDTEPGGVTTSFGPFRIDDDNHEVTAGGDSVELTITEYKLLRSLVLSRGRVLTREMLLADVWGYDADAVSRTVDTHIRRLRQKIGTYRSWISTVRGVGYRLQDPSAR